MWKVYALLAAVFAALTAIFSKIGVRDIDSNLATAIRVSFILILTWGIVLASGAAKGIRAIGSHSLLFLFLSAMATGLSWLFCPSSSSGSLPAPKPSLADWSSPWAP